MKYCIDASALIDLGERHYPEHLTIFAPIWNDLYSGIDDGEIVSVDYVKKELEEKADDWRTKFLSKASNMFLISANVEMHFGAVVSEIESGEKFLANKARDRFMTGADPWLIALARSIGECTVISAETKPIAAYGLGAVCDALGVLHINLIEFFKARKIGE